MLVVWLVVVLVVGGKVYFEPETYFIVCACPILRSTLVRRMCCVCVLPHYIIT